MKNEYPQNKVAKIIKIASVATAIVAFFVLGQALYLATDSSIIGLLGGAVIAVVAGAVNYAMGDALQTLVDIKYNSELIEQHAITQMELLNSIIDVLKKQSEG